MVVDLESICFHKVLSKVKKYLDSGRLSRFRRVGSMSRCIDW